MGLRVGGKRMFSEIFGSIYFCFLGFGEFGVCYLFVVVYCLGVGVVVVGKVRIKGCFGDDMFF